MKQNMKKITYKKKHVKFTGDLTTTAIYKFDLSTVVKKV